MGCHQIPLTTEKVNLFARFSLKWLRLLFLEFIDQHDVRILRNDFGGNSGLFLLKVRIGDMDVPSHDAERRVHTGTVGVEGAKLEVMVESYEECDKGRDGYKEVFLWGGMGRKFFTEK